jgi:hypothetical protein
MNDTRQLRAPILCALYDGKAFRIYRFTYGDEKPFSMGYIGPPDEPSSCTGAFRINDPSASDGGKAFILSLRAVSEVLYYCFLNSFKNGLRALDRSGNHGDISLAVGLADQAEGLAVQANVTASQGNIEKAATEAQEAFSKIDEWRVSCSLCTSLL